MEVNDGVGAGVERAELLASFAKRAVVIPERVVSPTVAEAETLHDACDKVRRFGAAIVAGMLDEVARSAAVGFHVENLAAEPLKPERVVDGLPHDASDGHFAHQAKQNDARTARDVHAGTSSAVGSIRVRTGRFVCISWSCL